MSHFASSILQGLRTLKRQVSRLVKAEAEHTNREARLTAELYRVWTLSAKWKRAVCLRAWITTDPCLDTQAEEASMTEKQTWMQLKEEVAKRKTAESELATMTAQLDNLRSELDAISDAYAKVCMHSQSSVQYTRGFQTFIFFWL